MYYKSVHYTKINGKIYIPGEEINAEIPEEDLQRLLEIGAIKETAPGIRKAAAEPAQAEPELEPEELEPEEGGEEEDPEEDAPEIDVMAGIVQDEKPEPKKTTRKKSEGRKAK